VYDPWIPVITTTGQRRRVGLKELFAEAAELADIEGDAPHVRIALLRLLLAILHRANLGPSSLSEWERWWREPDHPFGRAVSYLDARHDDFELFHPTRPFWQCPALTEEHAREAAKLVPSLASGNNRVWFDHTSVVKPASLSFDEAARWLIALQMFQPGGLMTGFPSGRASGEHAPLAGSAVVSWSGTHLAETLLLNTLVYEPATQPFEAEGEDLPVWERQPPSGEARRRPPSGYVDWLTWPSRRVRLFADSDRVRHVAITPGDALPSELEASSYEQMVPRRRAKQRDPFRPLRYDSDRALLREATALLLRNPSTSEQLWQRAPVVTHLDNLVGFGLIPRERPLLLIVAGLGVNQSKYVDWGEDALGVSAGLVADDRLAWLVYRATEAAEAAVDAAGYAARRSYVDDRRNTATGVSTQCKSRAWGFLDIAFDEFLARLPHDTTPAVSSWADSLAEAAFQAFESTAAPAISGRDLRSRVSAERWLRARISKLVKELKQAAEAAEGGASP
jgi:CRISPR system Cascade subunit CasA